MTANAEKVAVIDEKLAKHDALDAELKKLKAGIREVERRKDELVEQARAKITEEEAKELILARWLELLKSTYEGYLLRLVQDLVAKVENLWNKYQVTLEEIQQDRDGEADKLAGFLKELGYE